MKNINPEEFEEVYNSNPIKKLLDYYNTSLNKGNYYDALVNFISCVDQNNYYYAKTKADETLHRQGKNRKLFDSGSYKLSKFYESDNNLSSDLDEAFIECINQFIILNNAELKNAEEIKSTSGIKFAKSCMKTLIVLIFKSNMYELLSKVDLPRYITNSVNNLLTVISQSRFHIFNEYKESLKNLGYEELINIVDQIGMDDFFEDSKSKSIDMFNRFFEDELKEMGVMESDEYKKLLSHYENYKVLYHSSYDKLKIKDIIPYFNTPDNPFSVGIYDDRRPLVIDKINDISENLGDNSVINRLIYNENR